MTHFLFIGWIGFACPGGFLGGLTPDAAKPYVCDRQAQHYVRQKDEDALKAVNEAIGPQLEALLRTVRVTEVKDGKEREVKLAVRIELRR